MRSSNIGTASLGLRMGAMFGVLGYPVLFGVGFCIATLLGGWDSRIFVSLVAEMLVLGIFTVAMARSLGWLHDRRFEYPNRRSDLLVYGMSLAYLFFIAVNVVNSDTSGLFSAGGRLQLYFANDWYRRLVTFTTVPTFLATHHSVLALTAPGMRRNKAPYLLNLFLLFAASLLSGSKGAAVLVLAGSFACTFSLRRLPVLRIAGILGITTIVYVAAFLFASADPVGSLLGIVQRFYLSIDMSLLLQDRSTALVLGERLNDVWIEVFRSTASFGMRVSDSPIGSLVYEYAFGRVPETGANCRYASLLLMYPDRVDFLVGFPLLVCFVAYGLYQSLIAFGFSWAARVAVPYFLFVSFQDVYWFASHVAPLLLLYGLVIVSRMIQNALIDRVANTGADLDGKMPRGTHA